jgi:hypothetical protein
MLVILITTTSQVRRRKVNAELRQCTPESWLGWYSAFMSAQTQCRVETYTVLKVANTLKLDLRTRDILRQELNANMMPFVATHGLGIPYGCDEDIGVDSRHNCYIFGCGMPKQRAIC